MSGLFAQNVFSKLRPCLNFNLTLFLFLLITVILKKAGSNKTTCLKPNYKTMQDYTGTVPVNVGEGYTEVPVIVTTVSKASALAAPELIATADVSKYSFSS